MPGRKVEGSPYSAELLAVPDDGEGGLLAYAVVRPRFHDGEAMFKNVVWGGIEIDNYATTQTARVLRISVEDWEDRPDLTYEKLFTLALDGITAVVHRLNEIEDNSFGDEYR
jgi:hypothetical protein